MTEKELIQKLRQIQDIEPREDWVVLAKNRILSENQEQKQSFIAQLVSVFEIRPFLKPALVTAFCFCLLLGTFSFSQDSLPGDMLYSVKRMGEKAKISLASEEEKPRVQMEITQDKLNELVQIAEGNKGRNLAPAVEEVEKSVKETAEAIKKVALAENNSDMFAEVKNKVEDIQEKKEIAEEILATKIDTQELEDSVNNYYKVLVERELKDLEGRELSQMQQELADQVKELFEEGNYQEALEKILILGY